MRLLARKRTCEGPSRLSSSPLRPAACVALTLLTTLLALVPAGSAAHLGGARSASQAVVPSGAISYGYDSAGRLAAVSDPSNGAAKYAFDAVGNLTAVTVFGVAAAPKILSFSPGQGAVGALVTIFGTGFSATGSQDTVTFNGTVATVSFASATQLVVTVPSGATSGAISVTSPNGTVTSGGSFSVSSGGPAISGFSPTVAATGSTVTVSGSGFDTAGAKDVLAVGQARSQVASASGSSVSGTVEAVSSGHVTVGTFAGSAASSGVLFVPPSAYTAAQVDSTVLMAPGNTKTLSVDGESHRAGGVEAARRRRRSWPTLLRPKAGRAFRRPLGRSSTSTRTACRA
jgi:YD repeat-containing protein